MTTFDDSALGRDTSADGRRRFLKACGVSALAVSATPAIASCGLLSSAQKSVFEADAKDWLVRLAVAIGAGTIKPAGFLAAWWTSTTTRAATAT